MSYSNKKVNKKSARSRNLLIGSGVVVAAAAILLLTGVIDTSKSSAPEAGSTSATNESSGNTEKRISTDNRNPSREGGAVDTHGQTAATTPSSQWSTSPSGVITVKSPIQNSLFSSGQSLSGSAKVNRVQYRLVDDSVGVLAQGSIDVVGGKFSATLNFKPKANSGHLDVFSYDSDGVETNSVRIALKL